jgi:hypothetical protein
MNDERGMTNEDRPEISNLEFEISSGGVFVTRRPALVIPEVSNVP